MIVMKFGGTSVECAESIARVVSIVRARLDDRPLVVVSALAGVTDRLHHMGDDAAAGNPGKALQSLAEVEQRHQQVIARLLSPAAGKALWEQLSLLFGEARAFLSALGSLREISPRSSDRLLSYGERWSSAIVTECLREAGIAAEGIDARRCIVTDSNHGAAQPLRDEIALRAVEVLLPEFERGRVPVVGGFIGATCEGAPSTLGRGGSDYTASLLGEALLAERIEIWTDVDGMLTADPRLCPEARNIGVIAFDEAAELAHFGAKVLHPKTLLPAMQNNIPVHVLNSRRPAHHGTRVVLTERGHLPQVKAVTSKRNMALLQVKSPDGVDPKLARVVFDAVAAHRCGWDMASMSRSEISLVLDAPTATAAADVTAIAQYLRSALPSEVEVQYGADHAVVCIVGHNIARDPRVSAAALAAIPQVAVQRIFHGGSDMNISFIVAERDRESSVRAIHAAFFEADAVASAAAGVEGDAPSFASDRPRKSNETLEEQAPLSAVGA